MHGACYTLLAATTSRNKRQTVEALAIDGTVQAIYCYVTIETQPIKLVIIVLNYTHAQTVVTRRSFPLPPNAWVRGNIVPCQGMKWASLS